MRKQNCPRTASILSGLDSPAPADTHHVRLYHKSVVMHSQLAVDLIPRSHDSLTHSLLLIDVRERRDSSMEGLRRVGRDNSLNNTSFFFLFMDQVRGHVDTTPGPR